MDQEDILQRTLQVNVIAHSPQWVTRERKGRERLPASECTQLKPAHCNCIAAASGKESGDSRCNAYNWALHKRVLSLTESIAVEILILKKIPRPGQPFAHSQGKFLLSFGNQFLLGLDWDSCWVAKKSRNFRESWKRPKLAKPRQDLKTLQTYLHAKVLHFYALIFLLVMPPKVRWQGSGVEQTRRPGNFVALNPIKFT